MKKVRLEFLSSGFRDLLCSDEVAELITGVAADVAETATDLSRSTVQHTKGGQAEYEVKGPKLGKYGGGRVIVYVSSANKAAYLDAVRHMILEKAVNAHRIH